MEDIEKGFEALLHDIQPKQATFDVVCSMLKDLWQDRSANAASVAAKAKKELEKLERKAAQVMERLLAATSPTLITAYEGEIQKIEESKLVLTEKSRKTPEKLPCLEDTYPTALEILANPWKLWASERVTDRRILLRLAFTGRLAYCRKSGYPTAKTTLPFKVLAGFKIPKSGMVQKKGTT